MRSLSGALTAVAWTLSARHTGNAINSAGNNPARCIPCKTRPAACPGETGGRFRALRECA